MKKDYLIEFELDSIASFLTGLVVREDEDEAFASLTFRLDILMSLVMYGIENVHMLLESIAKDNGLLVFGCESGDGDKLVEIVCPDVKDYKALGKTIYLFYKKIASMRDKIMITFEDDGNVIIHLPILSMLQERDVLYCREVALFLGIFEENLVERFGESSYSSVGIRCDEETTTKIEKFFLTVRFNDRDESLSDIEDINELLEVVMNSSFETLDIIFKKYKEKNNENRL